MMLMRFGYHLDWCQIVAYPMIWQAFWLSMGGNTTYQNLLMQSSHAFLYGNVGPSLTNQIWFAHAVYCLVWHSSAVF